MSQSNAETSIANHKSADPGTFSKVWKEYKDARRVAVAMLTASCQAAP
jgi:hypothetical protein